MTRVTGLIAVLLAAAGVLVGAAGTAAAGAAPFTTPSANLIVDGDAEAGMCTHDLNAATTIPGWTVTGGSPNIMCYPQDVSHPATPAAGQAFFGPGPYLNTAAFTQTASVTSAASAIDTGTVRFQLSGWLGGRAGLPGRARVTVAFLGASGAATGPPASLATVTAAERQDQTALLARSTIGTVPAGTRTMTVTVRFLDTGGSPGYSTNAEESGSADNLSLVLSTPVHAPTLTPPPSTVPRFDHVFMIMMENTNASAVIGPGNDMPFLDSLRARGATLVNYHAVYHPSDENYLAIAGGDTYAKGARYWPVIQDRGTNLGDELEAKGLSWKAYEQGMGVPCNASPATEFTYDPYYYPDDAPFINYTDISSNAARCQAHLVDTNELAGDLQRTRTTPAFSWLAADDYYDGESSGNGDGPSREVQDAWLDETITPILNSAAWHTQRSLLIITWDESENEPGNEVAAVVVGSQGTVRSGYVSHVRYDHYSTGATIEDALGLPPITANDRYATPFDDAFIP